MTDKKLTDAEIVKAAKEWKYNLCVSCKDDLACDHCVAILINRLIDLINRQKAEIERLQKRNGENTDFLAKLIEAEKQKCKVCVRMAEAEAIKEFSKRVKEKMQDLARVESGDKIYFLVGEPLIDDIEKQMMMEV